MTLAKARRAQSIRVCCVIQPKNSFTSRLCEIDYRDFEDMKIEFTFYRALKTPGCPGVSKHPC